MIVGSHGSDSLQCIQVSVSRKSGSQEEAPLLACRSLGQRARQTARGVRADFHKSREAPSLADGLGCPNQLALCCFVVSCPGEGISIPLLRPELLFPLPYLRPKTSPSLPLPLLPSASPETLQIPTYLCGLHGQLHLPPSYRQIAAIAQLTLSPPEFHPDSVPRS